MICRCNLYDYLMMGSCFYAATKRNWITKCLGSTQSIQWPHTRVIVHTIMMWRLHVKLIEADCICVGKLTIIDSDNGLAPGQRQAIILTNAGILLIAPLGRNFSEILIEIHAFSFKKVHLKFENVRKMASILSRAQCVNRVSLWCEWILWSDNMWAVNSRTPIGT